MNSWSRLCWPSFTSTRPSRNALLKPQLPQSGGALRLDAAGGLQHVEIVGAQAAAVDLQRAYVEGAALPAERCPGVHTEAHHGDPVVDGACVHPAGSVAEHLAGVLQTDRELRIGQACSARPRGRLGNFRACRCPQRKEVRGIGPGPGIAVCCEEGFPGCSPGDPAAGCAAAWPAASARTAPMPPAAIR